MEGRAAHPGAPQDRSRGAPGIHGAGMPWAVCFGFSVGCIRPAPVTHVARQSPDSVAKPATSFCSHVPRAGIWSRTACPGLCPTSSEVSAGKMVGGDLNGLGPGIIGKHLRSYFWRSIPAVGLSCGLSLWFGLPHAPAACRASAGSSARPLKGQNRAEAAGLF